MSNALADIQKQLQQELAGLQDTIASSSNELIKVQQGKFFLPNGTSSPDPLNVVILGWRWINRYYKSAYNPNTMSSPECYAVDAVPADLMPKGGDDQQHTTCEGCKMNEFGTGQNGKGKACSNSARLAITSLDSDSEVLYLNIAATSLKSFTALLNSFNNTGVHPITALTTITIDTSVTYPKVGLESNMLHKADLSTLVEKRKKADEVLDAIDFNYS